MAGAYLEIIRGDSYTFSTNVAIDGVNQNIAGSEVSLYAISDLDGCDTVLINVNTASGVSVNVNRVTVNFNSAFTANIPEASSGRWFLRANTAAGLVYTLDRGRICVLPGYSPLSDLS